MDNINNKGGLEEGEVEVVVDSDEVNDFDNTAKENNTANLNFKKSFLVTMLVVLVAVAGFLLWQKIDSHKMALVNSVKDVFGETIVYQNEIYGYEFEYPTKFDIVADGNIPEQIKQQGVTSLEMMGLYRGDVLLVEKSGENGNNIVYTMLSISEGADYVSFEDYLVVLRDSLEENGNQFDFEYTETEIKVGEDSLPAHSFVFEMDVPRRGGEEGVEPATDRGIFKDTVLELSGGRAISVSTGYPTEDGLSQKYSDLYDLILTSLDIVEVDSDNVDSTVKACTAEAKVCPDGTSVGRTGPNCEFAECPAV